MHKNPNFQICAIIALCISFLAIISCKKDNNNKTDNKPGLTEVKDIDGNVYDTVKIGTQVWMKQNLRTTRLNDGTPIPLVTDSIEWGKVIAPAYCWYNNKASYGNIYGALYNGYTVNTGKLCPTAWRVPTDSDWTVLIEYLGGDSIAGAKMKSIGTIEDEDGLWHMPNLGANNITGFDGFPGGIRTSSLYEAPFGELGGNGYWWSSTPHWIRVLRYSSPEVLRANCNIKAGISVRCLKD